MNNINKESSIYVAGHTGMVGSAIIRSLLVSGYENIIKCSHSKLDLTVQQDVRSFFKSERPEFVFLAAAEVGGIHANNTYPADFIYNNLMIQTNVIDAAYKYGSSRLLFLGSSCIYPRIAPQPMSEDLLLTAPLEPTNEPYAVSKIAGIKMCESYNRQYSTQFRSVMPTNLYGQNDNFHPENSHVIPALIRKIHEAKVNDREKTVIWGSGKAKREFLHVDDMAAGCLHVMGLPEKDYQEQTDPMLSHINLGSSQELSINELAELLRKIIGYQGRLVFDPEKPDGVPRKLLDSSKLKAFGWSPVIKLEDGLKQTYNWYMENNIN
jgi:GDP-L-fucose synthase